MMNSIPRAFAAATLLFLAACMAGPSTRIATDALPFVTPSVSSIPPRARALLDSLEIERITEPPVQGARVNSLTRPGTSVRPLPGSPALVLDSVSDLGWLDVLNDPQLVSFVREALSNNRDVETALGRVREYRAQVGSARSFLLPQISGNGGISTNKTALGPGASAFEAVRVTGDMSWELDFWGRNRRQVQAARFDLRGIEEDVRATRLILISDVALAYLQMRELDENVRIADETLTSRRVTLELARRRFAQGVTSELDVRQFEAQLAEPAARLVDFARQRARTENQLSQLVGRAPGPVARGGPLAEVVRAIVIPDSISGELIERRPDLRRAERNLQASISRLGATIASRLPTVTLGGLYGRQRPEFAGLLDQSAEIYTLQAGISIPLFTGGRMRNEQRAASARVDQFRSQYEQTVLTALRESSDALTGVRLGRDLLIAQATQVAVLERVFALATQRYEGGVSSYFEVLDAQRSLFAAQLTLVQIERQYLGSTVDLYRALGGRWNGQR